MKKLFSLLIALLIIAAFIVTPVFAETNKNEWYADIVHKTRNEFTDEGVKISLLKDMTVSYYRKKVNLRDFTVKFKINTLLYDDSWGYFRIYIGGDGKFTGSKESQNAVNIKIRNKNTVCLEPKICNTGDGTAYIVPSYQIFNLNVATQDIIIQGKQVDDEIYSLIFNNGAFVFEYTIPETHNYIEDVNGEGCIGFGGYVKGDVDKEFKFGEYNIVVKEINGVAMNVKDAVTSSSPTTSTNNTSSDKTDSTTTNINSDVTNDDGSGTTDAVTNEDVNETKENYSKSKKQNKNNIPQNNNIIIIVIGALLLITNIIIFSILLVRKKQTKAFVENGEDLEELQE